MKIFANRLKERASELGISNSEVARRANLAERRYANYTTGEREPDLATLVRISEVLGTTPNYLLGAGENIEQGARALLVARLNSAAQALSDDELHLVAVQIEALAAQHMRCI